MLERAPQILAAWAQRVSAERLFQRDKESALTEMAAWLPLIDAASRGDADAERELYKLVAFFGRSTGMEGLPPSTGIARLILLGEAITEVDPPSAPRALITLRALIRVAADAHALGQGERHNIERIKELREYSPVFRWSPTTVVGFLLGSMASEVLDPLIGRLLREAAASGARRVILDVSGAPPDDDRFHRTIEEILGKNAELRVELVLSGLRDPERTLSALRAVGTDLSRVSLIRGLGELSAE
ncbi:MAG: hypothetical protein U1E65_15360 [Myxococcota bacterium]